MNRIEALLSGRRSPGVYRWDGLLLPGTVVASVQRHGWRAAVLHGERAATKAAFLDECARSLSFPTWSARNWDALADNLRDLSWLPAIGYVVLWDDAGSLGLGDPEAYETAVGVLGDASGFWRDRNVSFSALLRKAPSGLPAL